jgi:PilZ domain-containing protein
MTPDSKFPRLYQRVRPVGAQAAKAQLIVGPKQPAVACRLVDYSAGGACLEISPTVKLPDRFELLHGSVRKKCRVVWRRGIRIGVAF